MDLASLPLRRPAIGPRAMVPLAGIVAGTLDLIYASTFWGIQKDLRPLQILPSVAEGWLGRVGGVRPTGVALHLALVAVGVGPPSRLPWRPCSIAPASAGQPWVASRC